MWEGKSSCVPRIDYFYFLVIANESHFYWIFLEDAVQNHDWCVRCPWRICSFEQIQPEIVMLIVKSQCNTMSMTDEERGTRAGADGKL